MVIKIGRHEIGRNRPCYIIAEIGSNHNGNLEEACRLIAAAASVGANAVKFQAFAADTLVSPRRPFGSGWEENPVHHRVRGYELPLDWLPVLKRVADEHGVDLLCTPFDEERADALCRLGVPAFKVASGDLTHLPLVRHIARMGKPVLLSTGAAYLGEVEKAVRTIEEEGNRQVVLLHCVSAYPAPCEEANLRAIPALHGAFGYPVGFSDHTPGQTVALGAVAVGAVVLEKHLTWDRNQVGPDHSFALTVDEFGRLVAKVRKLEAALGDGRKVPAPCERAERIGARRSLYAARDLPAGTLLTGDDIRCLRHAHGLPPAALPLILGRRLRVALQKGEAITWEHL